MTAIAAALQRMDSGLAKPRPHQATRKTQRYCLTDRFTMEELAQLVARYQAGEMSSRTRHREVNIPPPAC
ncbi:hypothetical protein AR689_15140 [Arthrobacter sp. EpRS71]|nr:hypothetical protein AR689_15140 [Arthrobacter sp. EpRS71]